MKAWLEALEDGSEEAALYRGEIEEIARLSELGEWAEKHECAIKDALARSMNAQKVSKISRYERALDAHPKGKRKVN